MPNRKIRPLVVSGARGGHGATTVANALGWFLRVPVLGWEPGASECLLGRDYFPPAGTSPPVIDAGVLRPFGTKRLENVVVLRGPSLQGLRTLKQLAPVIQSLFVIREPWRRTSNQEIEDVLSVHVAAEITFSERVSRFADAGLLGARLDKLEEFEQLRAWAAQQRCKSHLPLGRGQQMTGHP